MEMARKISRRAAVGGVLATALLGGAVWAQGGSASFPDKPVKIVVPFAPGAGTDAMGRLMAQKLGEVLGVSFVVENRTGASGAIGTQYVAQQPADGYTLLLVASPFTTVAASLPNAGYDPLKGFAPVGMIASGPLVWATNYQTGINTMQELVRFGRRGRCESPGAGVAQVQDRHLHHPHSLPRRGACRHGHDLRPGAAGHRHHPCAAAAGERRAHQTTGRDQRQALQCHAGCTQHG